MPTLTGLLEMDKHLKAVRRSLWDMRANWRDLGAELGITVGTLDVSCQFSIISKGNLC